MDKLQQLAENTRAITLRDMISQHAQVVKPEQELLFAFILQPESRAIISNKLKSKWLLNEDISFCFKILLPQYRNNLPVDTHEIHQQINGAILKIDFNGVRGEFWNGAIHTVRNNYLKQELAIANIESQKIHQNPHLDLKQKSTQINELYMLLNDQVSVIDPPTQKDKIGSTMDYLKACKKGDVDFCTWGLDGLDQYMKLRKHCCYFVGALPATGKTAFAISCIINQCRAGKRVFFWCGEMTEEQIIMRFISQLTGYALDMLENKGIFTKNQWAIISEKIMEIIDWDLITLCGEDMEFKEIASEVRTLHTVRNLDCVWIDYYSDILPKPELSYAPRYEQMADVSAQIKTLKKQLDIPIVTLAQLKRDAFDNRPKKTDLAESSSCERVADGILLLDRPVKGRDKNERNYWINNREVKLDELFGKCAIVIGKNRFGAECTSVYDFNGELMQFKGENIISKPPEPDEAPVAPRRVSDSDIPRKDING